MRNDPEMTTRGSARFTVLCEGPYGGCGHSLFAAYSSVMLVAGGSGITHTLGVAHDLICKAASQDAVRATHLDIVWVVRTQDVAKPLMSTFKSLIEDIKRAPLAVRVQIYVTRAPPHGGLNLLSPSTQEKMNAPFALPGTMAGGVTPEPQLAWSCGSGSRINIVQGARPVMDRLLQDLIDSSLDFNAATGTESQGCGVAVCGPQSLVDSVRRATMDMDAARRLRVGGIELLQERFD
jgi:ferric-chelate reductase